MGRIAPETSITYSFLSEASSLDGDANQQSALYVTRSLDEETTSLRLANQGMMNGKIQSKNTTKALAPTTACPVTDCKGLYDSLATNVVSKCCATDRAWPRVSEPRVGYSAAKPTDGLTKSSSSAQRVLLYFRNRGHWRLVQDHTFESACKIGRETFCTQIHTPTSLLGTKFALSFCLDSFSWHEVVRSGPTTLALFKPPLLPVSPLDTPSDLNLSAFLEWLPSVPLSAQYEVARARLPIIQHRHPLASGPNLSVRSTDGEQSLQPIGCTAVGCERCDTRGGYKWPWDGCWVCQTGRGSSHVVGNGNDIRQQWFSCWDPYCAGQGGLPVHTLRPANKHRQSPRCCPKSTLRYTALSEHAGQGCCGWRAAPPESLQRACLSCRKVGHHFRSLIGHDLRSAGGGQGSRFGLCRRTADASRKPRNSGSPNSSAPPVLDFSGPLSRAPCRWLSQASSCCI